jgi:hypothetical protein
VLLGQLGVGQLLVADWEGMVIYYWTLCTSNEIRLWAFYARSSASIRDCVGRSIGPSVGRSVLMMQLRGKLVTSRLLREQEEEEENWLRRYSFVPRD